MKILIAGKSHPVLCEKLSASGYNCFELRDYSLNEVRDLISDFDGLIVRSKIHVDKELIDLGTKLKFIGRIGAGIENIDSHYADTKGIKIFNSPEGNKDALAEHSLGMLLSLMNHLNIADNQIRSKLWVREKNRGHEIKGKTVGIIGYGNMGSAFAQRLSGFDAEVIAYDKYKTGFSDAFVKECSLEELYNKTDIFSVNLPLTPETLFLINDKFIKKFHKGIYLINTSRGKILRTSHLIKSINNGKILGAALDVLEFESGSFSRINANNKTFNELIRCDKVILSPHIAGWSVESEFKLCDILADKIISFL